MLRCIGFTRADIVTNYACIYLTTLHFAKTMSLFFFKQQTKKKMSVSRELIQRDHCMCLLVD